MSAWDGRMFALKICPNSSPELYSAIKDLSPRARAERVRQLATVGLSLSGLLGGRVVQWEQSPDVDTEPCAAVAEQEFKALAETHRNTFISRIREE